MTEQVYLGSKHKPLLDPPNILEFQKSEYEKFLQKDTPPDKREDIGLHYVLKEIFGLADTFDVIVEKMPDDNIIRELSNLTGKSPYDIKIAIIGKMPIKRMVKDYSPFKSLDEANLTFVPSGLRVTENNVTVILQYKDYGLKGPNYIEDDNNLFYLTQRIGLEKPRESPRFKDVTYAYRLYVKFRVIILFRDKDPLVAEDTVFLTDIPAMTKDCTFIINGTPRTIVSVINRFVGVSFKKDKTKERTNSGRQAFIATIDSDEIFNHKTITFALSKDDVLYVVIGKLKIPAYIFIRALGVNDDLISSLYSQDLDLFPDFGKNISFEDALVDFARKILNIKFVNAETASQIYPILFSFRLGPVGRLITNRRLENMYVNSGLNLPTGNYLTVPDILMTIKYLTGLCDNQVGYTDDDTLSFQRRYVKTVRSLLEEVFLLGLDKLSKITVAKIKNTLLGRKEVING
jgi:DNA-directed RNA polymerase beta subunit